MHPVKLTRPLLALLATILLAACATAPQPSPEQIRVEPPAQSLNPSPRTLPQPLCAWSQLRGIATVLSLTSSMTDVSLATWQFFPGDDIVFHPAPQGARVGDEYKAMLRRPLNGPCQPELYLVGPLEGDNQ